MLSGPSFIPNDVQNALILFHGFGANGDDLYSLVPYLKNHFPKFAFFMPDAPSITFGGGYEWFSLDDYFEKQNLDEEYLNVLTERAKEKIPLIQEYLLNIKQKTNLQNKDIFIGGFSQGGLMAAQTVFHEKEVFSGLILMSPVPPNGVPASTLKQDVLITRGGMDTIIPPLAAKLTKPMFDAQGFNTKEVIDFSAPHAITQMHLDEIISFIQSHLS